MKKLLNITVFVIIFISNVALAQDKIVVVNINKILQRLPQIAITEKNLEHEFKSRAQDLQDKERDLQKKIQIFQHDSLIMKNIEKIRIEKEITIQKENFTKQLHEFEKDNNRRHVEERNKILIKIQNEVNKIALQEGYDLIIDASSVIFSIESKDITEYVLSKVK